MNKNAGNKSKYVWLAFLPTIIVFSVQNIISIFIMEIYIMRDFATYKTGTFTEFYTKYFEECTSPTTNGIILFSYAAICTVTFFILYYSQRKKPNGFERTVTGISSNTMMMVAGIVIVSVGLQMVSIYLMNAVGAMLPDWVLEYQKIVEASGMGDTITVPMLIYALVLGPICEELAFRGLTFSWAKKAMPYKSAILIQALMFGAFHLNKYQFLYTFVMGLMLGYIMYKYDNIIICMVVHMIYNMSSVFIDSFIPDSNVTIITFFLGTLGALVATYGGLILLNKAAPKAKEVEMSSDI